MPLPALRRPAEATPDTATSGLLATLAGNRDLARVLAAFAAVNVAEWGYVTALAVVAYRREGAVAVGLVGLRMFFAATSTFLSSAFVPRWRVGRTLSAIAAGRAVGVAVSAALAASGAPFALLLLMVALDATLAGPYRPAQAALVPGLARAPRELVAMATGLSTAKTLSQALGAVAGGVLLAVTSPFAVFGGAAAVFVAAASITAGFARSAGRPPGAGRPVDLIASLRQTVRLSRQPGVTNILTVSGLRTFVRGMWVAIAVIASLKLLHAGSSGVGLLSFAAGIGSIVAAPISARLVRLRHLGTPAAVALVGCGVPLAIIAGVPVFDVALAVVAAWGVGMAVADVATTSLLHRLLEAPACPGSPRRSRR